MGKGDVILNVGRLDQLFLPEHTELIHRSAYTYRILEIPSAMPIVGNRHIFAHRSPDLPHWFKHQVQIVIRQVHAPGWISKRISEGPFHDRDTIVKQTLRYRSGIFHRQFKIMHITVRSVRVVSGDAIAAGTSEQVVDGLLGNLPGDIPQCDVNCRDRSGFCARKAKCVSHVEHVTPVALNGQRIFPDEHGREDFVNGSRDSPWAKPGLPKPNYSTVCVNLNPRCGGKLV